VLGWKRYPSASTFALSRLGWGAGAETARSGPSQTPTADIGRGVQRAVNDAQGFVVRPPVLRQAAIALVPDPVRIFDVEHQGAGPSRAIDDRRFGASAGMAWAIGDCFDRRFP
jgi:hypothetical protein